MATSLSKQFVSIFLAFALFVTAVLGRMTCEQLDRSTCAFAVSSNGLRCLLEKHVQGAELGEEVYTCRTTGLKATVMAGWMETDACIATCGLERETVGISSDSLLDRRFMGRLCSPECFLNCPNIVDLYFSIAAGEGAFLPNLCRANGFRREIYEKMSYASGLKIASSSRLLDRILHLKSPMPRRNIVEFDDRFDRDISTPTAEKNQINSNVDLSPTSAPQLNSHARPHVENDKGRKNHNRMTVAGKTVFGKRLGPERSLSGDGGQKDRSRQETGVRKIVEVGRYSSRTLGIRWWPSRSLGLRNSAQLPRDAEILLNLQQSSLLTLKLRPSEAGAFLCHQQTSDFYPVSDLHSSPSFYPTQDFYRLSDFVGRLCEDAFLSIVGLLLDAVLLIFVVGLQSFRPPSPVDYDPPDLCRLPTTVFPTSVVHRLRSSWFTSPADYSPSDLRRPSTTVLLTYVARRLQSFRPPSPIDYGPPGLRRPPTTVLPTSVAS
ncbi:hypothetical protein MA16_Dca013332 [Dendrobium catenatum]|uniref:PAR1 protein n=1 Tax=Dendrobium catenatum TaxID=906689 RepID=A0A2I0WDM2_9ASPA|nr:hypothetical protein MA16_Dca013332 [Dendrobium catenatum]